MFRVYRRGRGVRWLVKFGGKVKYSVLHASTKQAFIRGADFLLDTPGKNQWPDQGESYRSRGAGA